MLNLRVIVESHGRSVGARAFTATISGGSFLVHDRNGEQVARGDILGSVPIVVAVEHDAPSLKGVALPAAALSRAVAVALETERHKGAA